jgi:hypothetical protein
MSSDPEIENLQVNQTEQWRIIRDLEKRMLTLQTPLWKRVLFRIDGWPGQKNLNAEKPEWRPWRRWWTS